MDPVNLSSSSNGRVSGKAWKAPNLPVQVSFLFQGFHSSDLAQPNSFARRGQNKKLGYSYGGHEKTAGYQKAPD